MTKPTRSLIGLEQTARGVVIEELRVPDVRARDPLRSVPRGIAVDGAHVYWTCAVPCGSDGGPCGGAVMSVPLGGGTPVTLVSNQDTPWAIAVERHQRVLDEQRPGHR